MRQIILILVIILAMVLSGCSGNKAEQLFDTAKLEELQDNREHATRLYQEIIERYPQSEYAKRAKERLSALTRERGQTYRGCCPNKNSFERSLRRFLPTNLGEAEDQRLQLFEPEGRVLKSPEASLRFVKKRFRPSEKGFGQQPVHIWQKIGFCKKCDPWVYGVQHQVTIRP